MKLCRKAIRWEAKKIKLYKKHLKNRNIIFGINLGRDDESSKICPICKRQFFCSDKRFKLCSLKCHFYSQVDKNGPNGCWLWTGAKTGIGYGDLNCKSINKHYSSHRASYLLHIGKIPHGLYVCHNCDNKLCVNPAHLFIGTHTDNIRDAINKGIFIPTKPKIWKKKRKNRVVLKPKIRQQIKKEFINRPRCKGNAAKLSKKYNVSIFTIYKIVKE